MGLFHRGKKNNDDEPDSVQTNSFSDIMNGLQYAVNCAQDGSPDKPGGLSIQLCKSEKKEFYIRYSS